jgi:WD40 repeat protein
MVISAEFSPDEERVVTASRDRTARVWNANSGEQLFLLEGGGDEISSAEYSSDGSRILTSAGELETSKIWNAKSGKLARILSNEGISSYNKAAAFSPDGNRVIADFHIYDARTGEVIVELPEDSRGFSHVAFSPDGSNVLMSSSLGHAKLLDARTGTLLRTFADEQSVLFSTFNSNGSRVLTTSDDRTVRIWSVNTGEELNVISLDYEVNSGVAVNRSDSIIAICKYGGQWAIELRAANTGENLLTIGRFREPGYGCNSIAFNNNADQLLVASNLDDKPIYSAEIISILPYWGQDLVEAGFRELSTDKRAEVEAERIRYFEPQSTAAN